MKTTQRQFLKKQNILVLISLLALAAGCMKQGEGSVNSGKAIQQKSASMKAPVTDIHAAAVMGDLATIREHIKYGTKLDSRDPIGGSTPLITASVFGHTEIVNSLISAGADLNARNNEGATALLCASLFCHTEIVEALLAANADKELKNNAGETAQNVVEYSFEKMKPAYDFLSTQLGPLGLKLDYNHLERTRPLIAQMLRQPK